VHLGNLTPNPRKLMTRVGRGNASKGKTCGRGGKGQSARTSGGNHLYFEGGQMPLYRVWPKRGFNNANFKTSYQLVNLQTLSKYNGTEEITKEFMVAEGLIQSGKELVKVLAKGEIKSALKVHADKFSKSAIDKIKAAGGEAIIS